MIFRSVAAWLGLFVAGALMGPVQAASLRHAEAIGANATTFLLSGVLTGGETAALREEVAKLPPGQRVAVILDSPGGLVAEGLKLGRFFYDARIATVVVAGGIGCHSACSLAFLGGRDAASGKRLRVMMSGARLGFHQFSAKFDPAKSYTRSDMSAAVENAHRVMDAIVDYLRGIDEDLTFLTLMLRAPHETIALLDEDAALERGIHVVARGPLSSFDPYESRRRLASQ
jgi:hypothetical protein